MRKRSAILLLGLTLFLGACGFHLRNSQDLPFATIYIDLPESSELRALLARNIRASSKTEVVSDAAGAEAVFIVTSDLPRKVVLSLNTSGRVREYQLIRTFSFRLLNNQRQDLMVPAKIEIRRDISYTDDLVLSKEAEEVLLWRDMQNDMAQQVLRRLAAAKNKPIDPDQQ